MSTTAALATLEGRKLVRHPVCLAGVVFAVVGTAMFVRATLARSFVAWGDDGWTVHVGFLLLAILTMVATNLAALRDRREETVQQHETLPLARSARTYGLLAGILWPAVLSAALLGVVLIYAASVTDLGDRGLILLPDQLATVLALGALGVALARWLPNPFVAPVVAWALVFVAPGDTPARWHVLLPLVTPSSVAMLAWHIVYLAGLGFSFAALALSRRSRRAPGVADGRPRRIARGVVAGVPDPGVCPAEGHCLL